MADRAFVIHYDSIESVEGSSNYKLRLKVAFLRESGVGSNVQDVDITFNWGDTVEQMKVRMLDGIILVGQENGFILVAGDIILPTFQKG